MGKHILGHEEKSFGNIRHPLMIKKGKSPTVLELGGDFSQSDKGIL